jgi:hypothetical protein
VAKVKAFRAEYGSSIEIQGVWHKIHCAVEIELDKNEQTPEKIAEIKEKAWNTVIVEVEKQFKEITG